MTSWAIFEWCMLVGFGTPIVVAGLLVSWLMIRHFGAESDPKKIVFHVKSEHGHWLTRRDSSWAWSEKSSGAYAFASFGEADEVRVKVAKDWDLSCYVWSDLRELRKQLSEAK